MNFLFLILSGILLSGCNAYRTTPDSEIMFTKQDLTKRGFVVAPLIDSTPEKFNKIDDLNAFDSIFVNILAAQWKEAPLLSTAAIIATLDDEVLEEWRVALKSEDQLEPSAATLQILKKLTALGKSYPKQVVFANLLQNSVICSHKEALPTYLASEPRGPKAYCQRVMKMRFRILNIVNNEFIWNGLIYATQESNQNTLTLSDDDQPIEPPSTQSLIRECFMNFAHQFADQ